MGAPKMTLRIELKGDKQATIKLLHVTDAFTREYKEIYTANQWVLRRGPHFTINMFRGVITFPPKIDDNCNVTLSFTSDRTRRILLRDISNTLLLWSRDMFFRSNKSFSEEPSIRYHKKLWIIY